MLSMIVAVALGSLVSAGIHFYVWLRGVRPMRLPRPWHAIASIAIAVMFFSIPLTTTSRLWAPGLSSVLGWISLPWMAFAGLTFVALVAIDLVRLAYRVGRRAAGKSPDAAQLSRRQFLARVTGGAAMVAGGTAVAGGMIEARGEHDIVTIEVALPKLPRQLDGFTIVQLTDLHAGMTIDRGFVQKVVDRANALSPDLIALTGDLVDGKVPDLADDVAPLAQLRAKHGVYAVTGNHEYYSGADAWIAAITKLGARYLRNERVTIGDGAASFDLAGVDDYSATPEKTPGHGEDLGKATAGRDPARALVLLAHQPRQVHNAAAAGVDLQLSGHTHGGQIWPWHYIVRMQQGGLLAGHYRVGDTQLYVSRGCGYWGPPVRVLAALEITKIVLRSTFPA